MAGIVAKKKKSSAVLKDYTCTGVYLACMYLYLYLRTFESTCTLLKYFAKNLAPCLTIIRVVNIQ